MTQYKFLWGVNAEVQPPTQTAAEKLHSAHQVAMYSDFASATQLKQKYARREVVSRCKFSSTVSRRLR